MEISNFYSSKFLDPLNSIHDLKNVKRFCSVARAKIPSAYRGQAGGIAEVSSREWRGPGGIAESTHTFGGWRGEQHGSGPGTASLVMPDLHIFKRCQKYQFLCGFS